MSNGALLEVNGVSKLFPVRGKVLSFSPDREFVHAVDDVSFSIRKNSVFSLAGESGCGKTTTARLIVKLLLPTKGEIFFKDKDIFTIEEKEYRREVQMVFQDPYASLNPYKNVRTLLTRPLNIHGYKGNLKNKLGELLEMVKLTPIEEYLTKYPHQLSGGERQRVAIARALSTRPELIVLDEPISMLDMSIRATMFNLLENLKEELHLSYLYITHDLASISYFSDEVGIMYLGKIVERGTVRNVIGESLHPYTKLLLSSVPSVAKEVRKEEIKATPGDVPKPTTSNLPGGCRFSPRCPFVKDTCRREKPQLVQIRENHFVACHLIN